MTLWTVAHQAPLSMGFSRQEYWSELPFLSPGDLPDPGIELTSLKSSALTGGSFTTSTTSFSQFWDAPHPVFFPLPFRIFELGMLLDVIVADQVAVVTQLSFPAYVQTWLYLFMVLAFSWALCMISLVAMLNACMFSHSVVSDSILISWAVTLSAPLSLGFPRQEYWSELPFPPPGDLPDPGIKPGCPALLVDSLPLLHLGSLLC